ncbi:MAG: family 2 glycosyl [Desulfobulbaceae bacterium]|nr:MAG: family 2 glycosyl [Desulfobulbaceae bacterium]
MYRGQTIAVVIPALNEENNIGPVIRSLPSFVDFIVVGDNGSTDNTAKEARNNGAIVICETRRGYGSACLAALSILKKNPPAIVVFTDADGSDDPSQMEELIRPLLLGKSDLTVASRATGIAEKGSLTSAQRFGNWLATRLIRLFWLARFTDLGPYRAITWQALDDLHMSDPDFGWTVEMQIKAARLGLKVSEIPANYRKRRLGKSKVGGSLCGSTLAGGKILWWIFWEKLRDLVPAKT